MSRARKVALGIVFVLMGVGILLAIVVPLLVDVDRYRPQVIARIQQETGKPAQIGHLSLNIFPEVSIRVDNFTLGNPPGFPSGPFVEVERLNAVVNASALWNRQVVITSLELDAPVINLLSDGRGHWNYENSTAHHAVEKGNPGEKPLFTLGVISKVNLKGGRVSVAELGPSGKLESAYFQARGASCRLHDVDLMAMTGVASSASLYAAPVFSQTLWTTETPLLYAAAPQARPAAEGTLDADWLRFQTLEATAVSSHLSLFPKLIRLDDIKFDFCGGRAAGNAALDLAGRAMRYSARARLTGLDMAKLLAAFPSYKGKMTGTMEGNAEVTGSLENAPGPLAGVQGKGQATIRNGKLPTLQINKNLMLLARFSNLGPASGDPSSFSSLSADFNIADQKITSNKIAIVGNGVNVDGSGTVDTVGTGSLDYQGVASLAAGQNAVSTLLAGLSGAKLEGGKLQFPFALLGSFEAPKFVLKSLAGGKGLGALGLGPAQGNPSGQAPQPADLVQGISNLFKKKKNP